MLFVIKEMHPVWSNRARRIDTQWSLSRMFMDLERNVWLGIPYSFSTRI
jgi:hypothetical protein